MSKLSGDWGKFETLLNPSRIAAGIQQAAARVGNYGASEVKKGIVSGAPGGQKFAPLSPVTIARKGSSKPLIDKGDLVGSITYQVVDADNVFIGVKKGKEVSIAAVHEFGCTIGVTPKMRAYLHYQDIHLRASTQYIHIPPRPFLRPVLLGDDFKNKVAEIYIQAIERVFSG